MAGDEGADQFMTRLDTRPAAPDPESLLSFGQGKLSWRAIAPIWDAVSIYESPVTFLAQFASVSEAQGLLLAAYWCQSEVCNGGFHQFFLNRLGFLRPKP